jgi:hypothetical protein
MRLGGLGRALRVDDNLRQTIAVAQVDEDQLALVPAVSHPAGEDDTLAFVGGGQLATGDSAEGGGMG